MYELLSRKLWLNRERERERVGLYVAFVPPINSEMIAQKPLHTFFFFLRRSKV